MRKPIRVEEAIWNIMEYTRPGRKEWVNLEECYHRILAEDLVATIDIPWFRRSPYDGYALVAGSTEGANSVHPVYLEVLGTIGAGDHPDIEIKPGQAVKIMTGAPVPE